MAPAGGGANALLNQIIAGQARGDQRFEELFRRLGKAEATAGEARDLSKEMVTILREQDMGARLTEMRAEMRQASAELRQDVVAANSRLREDLQREAEAREALEVRLVALENERSKVVGVASFFSWLAKVGPWLLSLGLAFWAGRDGAA